MPMITMPMITIQGKARQGKKWWNIHRFVACNDHDNNNDNDSNNDNDDDNDDDNHYSMNGDGMKIIS